MLQLKKMKYKVNDLVKVVKISDQTGDKTLLGKIGKIISFDFDCGCGQSRPNDCMYLVDFGYKKEEFWTEELRKHT